MREFSKYTNKIRLLFVEDDENIRELFGEMLRDFFKEIILAVDGEDGLKKFKENSIDLVITDINMPKMNGLEMLEEIKTMGVKIPTIILSAYMKPEYFLQSIKLGVTGYLVKPVNFDALFDILEDIFLNMRLRDEIAEKNRIIEQDHKFLQSIIDNSYESIMVVKEDYSVDLMNNSIKKDIDYSFVSDIENPKCYEVSHRRSTPCDGSDHYCPLRDVMQSGKSKTIVHLHHNIHQNIIHLELAAAPLFDENNKCIGIIETSRDITEHIMVQEQLREQKNFLGYKASHDALTGLANRTLFESRFEDTVCSARLKNTRVALFFIDLDKFKQINDTLGHKAGDFVLQALSSTMKKEIRKGDLLARIGGDEFTLIVENIDKLQDVEKLAKKILNAIEKPIPYENDILSLSASIGISIYPDDSRDTKTLLKHADTAMYSAKRSSGNIIYYSQRDNIKAN